MIELDQISKSFGDVVALSNVSASIGPGVTALLGPNGAGKSTLFRIIVGLSEPSTGSATVLGRSVRSDREVRSTIALVPQQDSMFEHMSASDFVQLNATLNGIPDAVRATREALASVGLDDAADRRIRGFSKGMRQRVKLAAALVLKPTVLVLDEPLNGLDPVQRRHTIALLRDLGSKGVCVVVSSHVLAEVAEIGSQVLIIVQGRLAAAGDYRALRRLMNDRPQMVRVETTQPRPFAALLIQHGLASEVSVDTDSFTIQTPDIDTFGRQIAPLARDHNLPLSCLEIVDDDLDAVFHYLTTSERGVNW